MSRGGSTSTNKGTTGGSTVDYYVCKVQDSARTVTFEAIPSAELKARERTLNESYVQAAKDWTAARRDGSAASDPPRKPGIVIGQKVKGRAMAESMAALLQEKLSKQRGGSDADSRTVSASASADEGTDAYAVAEIRSYDGTVSFEAIPRKDVKSREKQLNDDYAKALKERDPAGNAGAAGAVAPAPKKPTLRVVDKARDRAAAEKSAALLKEKWDANQKKVEAKDGGNAPGPKAVDPKAKEQG